MAASLEELNSKFADMVKQFEALAGVSKQLTGLHYMVKKTMDEVHDVNTRQTDADMVLADLRKQAEAATATLNSTTSRVDGLLRRMDSLVTEGAGPNPGPGVLGGLPNPAHGGLDMPPLGRSSSLGGLGMPPLGGSSSLGTGGAPPVAHTTVVQPPPRGLDLNTAPPSSSRSPTKDAPRPNGSSELCGGFTRPQYFDKGTSSSAYADPTLRPPPFPKLEFPKFDGSNPRLWRDDCLKYFEVYAVHPSLKTRFAALNFTGAAKTWLHTLERRGRVEDWELLCKSVMERFDKDQYPLVLKQFESIVQTATVDEYTLEFEQGAHSLLLYNPNYDETYFVQRFLAGLKEDIRAALVLHRPPNVDTASALALLQEAELSKHKGKGIWREPGKSFSKYTAERTKQQDGNKATSSVQISDGEDKLATLKAYRRRNRLCFKCGGKWIKDHKCPEQVPIHIIEELLDALEDSGQESGEEDSDVQEDTVMAVDNSKSADQRRRNTMKLCAYIGMKEILVLVDSRSVASFISSDLVSALALKTVACPPAQFVTADGTPMVCDKKILGLQWGVQGHLFSTNVGILPLKCFDMIVGEDWLEE